MDESGIALANSFFLLLSVAMGVLVLIGIGLFAYRYVRLQGRRQGLSEAELVSRAQAEWASDPSNPANRIERQGPVERDPTGR